MVSARPMRNERRCEGGFGRLWLWKCIVRGDEKTGVHDHRAVEYLGYEEFVPGPIDEREVAYELHAVPITRPLARRLSSLSER